MAVSQPNSHRDPNIPIRTNARRLRIHLDYDLQTYSELRAFQAVQSDGTSGA